MMGCDYDDNRRVAELIGVKTFLNEFIAYAYLSTYISNGHNLTWYENLPSQNPFNSTFNYTGEWYSVGDDIKYVDFSHTLVGGVLTVMHIICFY